MNAVIYARYSDEKQTEQSIEGQLNVCNAFAVKHGYTVIETYIDRAMSGKVSDRPAFMQLISDSKKQAFEIVIVYQLDRFARNSYDNAVFEYKLNKNKVRLVSANENISDDPSGRLLKQVLIGLNEYYVAELAIKVDRGMKLTAEKCKHNGGNIPFGLTIDANRHYIPDPATAKYVKQIFERFTQGETLKKIVAWLNANNVKTINKKPFTVNSLPGILRNERYTGTYTWREYRVEDAFEQLISRSLFDKAQATIESNRKAPSRGRMIDYMLSTKITCGICGSSIIGASAQGRSKIYYYYSCYSKNFRKGTVCAKKRIHKDKLEELVYNTTMDLVGNDGFIDYAVAEATRVYNEENTNHHVIALEAQLKEAEHKLENLFKVLESGSTSQVLIKRISTYETDIDTLRLQIAKEKNKVANFTFDANVFRFFIDKMLNKYSDDREKHMKNIFNNFIRSITLWDDKIEICYNYADEQNKKQPKTEVLDCLSLIDMVGDDGIEPPTSCL